MKIDPIEYAQGQTVHLVLETHVARISYEASKDDPNKLVRVHTLKAGTAAAVDASLVAGVLDEQRERLEAAEGAQRIPYGDPDDDPNV